MTLSTLKICKFFRRVEKETKIKDKKNLLIVLMIAIGFLATTPGNLLAQNDQVAVPVIKLSLDSPSAVTLIESKPVIVPGESVVGKEARLQAEAAAAAVRAATVKQAAVQVQTYADPSNFDTLYQEAGNAYGVDWHLLKAVHTVETGASGSTARSNPSGATGPMQFLPSTFRHYAVDGNGDGITDVHNVSDAVFSAAKYLKACGYPDVHSALWGYNPSTRYCAKVIALAKSFGMS